MLLMYCHLIIMNIFLLVLAPFQEGRFIFRLSEMQLHIGIISLSIELIVSKFITTLNQYDTLLKLLFGMTLLREITRL